jgi:hypothetical protein
MMDNLTQAAIDYYAGLAGCCGVPSEKLEQVKRCVAFEESEGDGPSGAAVFQLNNGNWAVAEEWQDYTGHGCQCGANWTDCIADDPKRPFRSLKSAVNFGLGEETRTLLAINHPKINKARLLDASA